MWPLYVQTAMTDQIKTGTTESLGIRLTAQDVADAIVAATEPSWLRRAIHQVHFPVGSQTKVMAAGFLVLPRVADPAGQQATGTLLMFKLTVEDVFVIRNRGVVATGRVESGTLRVGDTVQHQRRSQCAGRRHRDLPQMIDEANAGDNIGVLFKSIDKSQIDRGAMLTSFGEGLIESTNFIL